MVQADYPPPPPPHWLLCSVCIFVDRSVRKKQFKWPPPPTPRFFTVVWTPLYNLYNAEKYFSVCLHELQRRAVPVELKSCWKQGFYGVLVLSGPHPAPHSCSAGGGGVGGVLAENACGGSLFHTLMTEGKKEWWWMSVLDWGPRSFFGCPVVSVPSTGFRSTRTLISL